MGAIYLRHPIHGEKVESSDIIATQDRANGWVDFDPTPVAVPSFLKPSTPLPENFPGREALVDAGLLTLESVAGKTKEELMSISGIGDATARRILDAQ